MESGPASSTSPARTLSSAALPSRPVNHVNTELRISGLASQLPEFLTIDLGDLTKGQTLHVNDIKLPAGTKVMTQGKPNPVIVSVSVQAEEEEVVAAPVVTAAPAEKSKAKKTETKQ